MAEITYKNVILGVQKDPEDSRDYLASNYLLKIAQPLSTTVSVVDHEPSMTAIKNQGPLGSCVAFAVCAVKEWQEKQEHKLVTSKLKEYDLSEQWLYYKCKEVDCWPGIQGTSFRYAMQVVCKAGVPVEQGWNYDPVTRGAPEKWAEAVASWYKCAAYWRISSLEEFKTLIVKGPIAIGITCFDEIFSPVDGVIPLPKKSKPRGGHAICLSGDTRIPLLNGEVKTIRELSELKDSFWVYSCDENHNIVPGQAHSARCTGHKPVYRLTLDNGESIKCTEDHLIMRRDGTYTKAKELQPGDSLMPLYRQVTGEKNELKGYEKVLNPQNNKWMYTHRIVSASCSLPVLDKFGEAQINAWHNNGKTVAGKLSIEQKKLRSLKSAYTRWYRKDYDSFEAFLRINIDRYIPNDEDFKNRILQLVIPHNHKVVKVELVGSEDVYDLTVEKFHNFAIESGVFVHNCAVGFSDETKLIKFKNSWGTSWGKGGYGFISYDYFNSYCLDAWYFEDTTFQASVSTTPQPSQISTSTPAVVSKKEKVVMDKIKLVNKLNQLLYVHITRNGRDTAVPIVAKGMISVNALELAHSPDIRDKIARGLLEKR